MRRIIWWGYIGDFSFESQVSIMGISSFDRVGLGLHDDI